MKRFNFKLQAVLTLRQRAEQAAMEKYSRALARRKAAATSLENVEMDLSEARRQWLNALADGCPAAQGAQMLEYCHYLEEYKRKVEQSLQLAEVELNQASQKMLFARQQREAIETCLDHARDQHDRELRVQERKELDDLVGRKQPVSFTTPIARPGAWN